MQILCTVGSRLLCKFRKSAVAVAEIVVVAFLGRFLGVDRVVRAFMAVLAIGRGILILAVIAVVASVVVAAVVVIAVVAVVVIAVVAVVIIAVVAAIVVIIAVVAAVPVIVVAVVGIAVVAVTGIVVLRLVHKITSSKDFKSLVS